MTLASMMGNDFDNTYSTSEHAESVYYTPINGLEVQITAFVDRDYDNQDAYVRGEEFAYCLVRARKSEVDDPKHGDTYTIDSETWEVAPEGVSALTRVGGTVYEWGIVCRRRESG